MDDFNPVLITSFFLLVLSLGMVPGVFNDLQQDTESPRELKKCFLAGIALSATLFLLFLALIGIEHALLCLSLAIGATLSLSHPAVALSFFLSLLLLRPWEFVSDNEVISSLPRIFAGIALTSWWLQMLVRKRFEFFWNETLLVFSLYLGWLVLSTLLAGNMDLGLNFILERFTPTTVVLLMAANVLRTQRDLEYIKRALVVSATGLVACALYMTSYYPQTSPDGVIRLSSLGLLGNSNDIAALIALALPLSMGSSAGIMKLKLSALLPLGASCLMIYGLLMTQSRGAMLALLVAGVCFGLFCRGKQRGRLLIVGAGALIPLLLFFAIDRDGAELSGSTSSRMNYIIAGLKMTAAHPVLGVGINQYPEKYELFTSSFYEWGNRTAHSSWVLALAESGLPGGLLFCTLFLLTFLRAWRSRLQHPALTCSLCSYAVTMSFLSHTYLFLPYVMCGVILACSRQQEPRKNHSPLRRTHRQPALAGA